MSNKARQKKKMYKDIEWLNKPFIKKADICRRLHGFTLAQLNGKHKGILSMFYKQCSSNERQEFTPNDMLKLKQIKQDVINEIFGYESI